MTHRIVLVLVFLIAASPAHTELRTPIEIARVLGLSDAAIEDVLKPDALVDQKTLADVADKLIEAANAAGGADNISIALIVI